MPYADAAKKREYQRRLMWAKRHEEDFAVDAILEAWREEGKTREGLDEEMLQRSV